MNELFEKYCGMSRTDGDGAVFETQTQRIVVERDLLARVGQLARPFVGDGRVAVVFDSNTLEAAGRAVLASLTDESIETVTLHLEPPSGHAHVVCDEKTVSRVHQFLADETPGGAIAVGSGTISDLVKMASFRQGIGYISVPTAPSNNGYTSAIAAILSEGLKTTQPCTPARAVFTDTGVLAHAPYRMIASGIGDLYSRPVSNADWQIAHHLLGSTYSPIVMEIVEAGSQLLVGVSSSLADRDLGAVAHLSGALMLSGLAMQAAGSSSPASGGEHLISHYLDMTAGPDDEPHDLHGCQVAVGTLVAARLYHRLLAWNIDTLDIEARVQSLLPWETYAEGLKSRFGDLAVAVAPQARALYPDPATLRNRLKKIRSHWTQFTELIRSTVREPAQMEAELVEAKCPVTFHEIGVSEARARRSVLHSKDIRGRYTILHLLWELGLLDAWGAEVSAAQYTH